MSYFKLGNLTDRENWNNGDRDGFSPPSSSRLYTHDPHDSFDACGIACKAHDNCFQWRYHLRKCQFVRSIRLGKHEEPGLGKARMKEGAEDDTSKWNAEDLRYMAGWDAAKISTWMAQRPCEEVQWVKPSTERIF